MEPVLDRLGLGYLLEVDAGAVAVGVDDRVGGVPLILGDALGGQELGQLA
jgi:hypothetical protein